MEYRRDIDRLRGIAVLSVLFFHTGIFVFSGDFVGMNVFLIYGFLIKKVILNSLYKDVVPYMKDRNHSVDIATKQISSLLQLWQKPD